MKTKAKQNFQDLILVQDSTSTLNSGPAQTGLQSNPIHAANIRRLTDSGGVSISIKEELEVGLDPVMDEILGDLDLMVMMNATSMRGQNQLNLMT